MDLLAGVSRVMECCNELKTLREDVNAYGPVFMIIVSD